MTEKSNQAMTNRPQLTPNEPVVDAYLDAQIAAERRARFVRDVASAVNCNSAENTSNTPDFILAEFMVKTLEAYESAVRRRAKWYDKPLEEPGRPQKSRVDWGEVYGRTPAEVLAYLEGLARTGNQDLMSLLRESVVGAAKYVHHDDVRHALVLLVEYFSEKVEGIGFTGTESLLQQDRFLPDRPGYPGLSTFRSCGTLWSSTKEGAIRHDGAILQVNEADPKYYRGGIRFSGYAPNSDKDVIRGRPRSYDHAIDVIDNCAPPLERIFLCCVCETRFTRPQSAVVEFRIDKESHVWPLCSPRCREQAEKT